MTTHIGVRLTPKIAHVQYNHSLAHATPCIIGKTSTEIAETLQLLDRHIAKGNKVKIKVNVFFTRAGGDER